MSFWKNIVISSSLIFLGLALLLWPTNIPDKMEHPDYVRKMMPITSLLNTLAQSLRYLGVKDAMIPQRTFMNLMSRFMVTESPTVDVLERYMQGVRVLVFHPKKVENKAAILFFHGGGYSLGSVELYASITLRLAEKLACVVISVDYRLAPEYIYPTLQQDVTSVTDYFFNTGYQEYNVDPGNIFLMGDSAGGHLAAALSLQYPSAKAAILVYPVLQHLSYNTPSYNDKVNNYLLPREISGIYRLLYFQGNAYDNYFGYKANNHSSLKTRQEYADKFQLPELIYRGPAHLDGSGDPNLIIQFKHVYEDSLNSPLFGDLSLFPPALIISCEYDILRDDSLMMVRRLRKTKRQVNHFHLNTFHGFLNHFEHYPPGQRAMDEILNYVTKQIAS